MQRPEPKPVLVSLVDPKRYCATASDRVLLRHVCCMRVWTCFAPNLELESVRLLTLGKRESSSEVLGHSRASLLNSSNHGLVQVLLVGNLALGVTLFVSRVSKEASLSLDLGSLLLLEVSVVDLFVNLNIGDINLGRGGNNVSLVNTSNGNTVHLERTSDEEKTRVELLEENDALATETTGEEDENGSGGDGGLELGLLVDLAVGLGDTNVFGGVEARSLLGGDETLAAVLGTLDRDFLVSGSLFVNLLGALTLHVLVAALLLEGLGAAQAGHIRSNLVAGHCVGKCVLKVVVQTEGERGKEGRRDVSDEPEL